MSKARADAGSVNQQTWMTLLAPRVLGEVAIIAGHNTSATWGGCTRGVSP